MRGCPLKALVSEGKFKKLEATLKERKVPKVYHKIPRDIIYEHPPKKDTTLIFFATEKLKKKSS